jgi:hypothetical protein
MTNILIFSTAALLSGIIFGAAFLSVAKTLRKDSSLRKHMIIAAYGFVLFYIAGSASAAQAAYPPLWNCFRLVYRIILLFDIHRLILFSSYCISRYYTATLH